MSQPTEPGRYRVTGSVPFTATVRVGNLDTAADTAVAAVTDAFAGRNDTCVLEQIDVKAITVDTQIGGQLDGLRQYRVLLTARGHVDVDAADEYAARAGAAELLAEHLSTAHNLVAHLDGAEIIGVATLPSPA